MAARLRYCCADGTGLVPVPLRVRGRFDLVGAGRNAGRGSGEHLR
jgi:hypothetical protein